MHKMIDAAAAVNPDAPTTCPKCGGEGIVKFPRPGGPVREICSVCSGHGTVDAGTAATVRKLMEADDIGEADFPPDPDDRAREEVLGPLEGPCCNPSDAPCVTCVPPDDVPRAPTEEDEAWYREMCRLREERLWAERIDAGPSFQEKFYALVNSLRDDLDDDIHGIGEFLGELADEARALEAKSWAQFLDRRQAMLDAKL